MKHNELPIDKLDKNMGVQAVKKDELTWYDPRTAPFQLTGFAWFQEEKRYRRLPRNPAIQIPPAVDRLADCTTGGQIRFRTNSTKLAIQVKLKEKASMSHMPATGQCGFDCYIGAPTKQLFCNATKYDHFQQEYEVTLLERDESTMIDITLNFPLYQGVEHVSIGMDHDAKITAYPDYDDTSKVIFYGTSITQGGCASRPGMAYTNILSRRFNREFINLGFSGNGKGEANMAKLISEIDNPACLVLDYEPNCLDIPQYKKTLPVFIDTYRQTHPTVPILLISKFPYASEKVNQKIADERIERLAFQSELIKQRKKDGDAHLYFYEGTDLLGEHIDEGTVDGSHPNDLGFMSIADKLTPVLKKILGE